MSFIVSGIDVTSSRIPARSITASEPLPPGSIPRKNSRSPISRLLRWRRSQINHPACLLVLLLDDDVILASEHHCLHSTQRTLNLRFLAAERSRYPAGFAGELRDHWATARFLVASISSCRTCLSQSGFADTSSTPFAGWASLKCAASFSVVLLAPN